MKKSFKNEFKTILKQNSMEKMLTFGRKHYIVLVSKHKYKHFLKENNEINKSEKRLDKSQE